jgi:uncharacterized protein (DUF1778 family)
MLPADPHKPAKPARSDLTARLDARLTGAQKELLEHAAALQGLPLTAFVLASAEEAALKTIREHEAISVSERDREVFIAALLNPPRPSNRLRVAAAAYIKEMGAA